MTIEQRTANTETRAIDGDEMVIEGEAAVFNSRTELWPGLYEEIAPGAFDESVARADDVRVLLNHDSNIVLGRTKSGTARVWADGEHLNYRSVLDEGNSNHVNTFRSMKRGDIDQSSFAFEIEGQDGEEFRDLEDGKKLRIIKRAKLFDVSPVTYPAYEDTTSGVADRANVAFRNADGISIEQSKKTNSTEKPEQEAETPASLPTDLWVKIKKEKLNNA